MGAEGEIEVAIIADGDIGTDYGVYVNDGEEGGTRDSNARGNVYHPGRGKIIQIIEVANYMFYIA